MRVQHRVGYKLRLVRLHPPARIRHAVSKRAACGCVYGQWPLGLTAKEKTLAPSTRPGRASASGSRRTVLSSTTSGALRPCTNRRDQHRAVFGRTQCERPPPPPRWRSGPTRRPAAAAAAAVFRRSPRPRDQSRGSATATQRRRAPVHTPPTHQERCRPCVIGGAAADQLQTGSV
eukprot:SAG11_NODE_284_length_11240_cov_6.333812_12_plen_175_part_00